MGRLLHDLDLLQRQLQDVDLGLVQVKIRSCCSSSDFVPGDCDLLEVFLVEAEMRMLLRRILLQEPDFLQLDAIVLLENDLKTHDVPMVTNFLFLLFY